jgi:hypothetical protein
MSDSYHAEGDAAQIVGPLILVSIQLFTAVTKRADARMGPHTDLFGMRDQTLSK